MLCFFNILWKYNIKIFNIIEIYMVKIIDNSELEVTKLKNSIKFNIKKIKKIKENTKLQTFYKTIQDILGVKKNSFSITGRNIIGFNDYIKSEVFLYKHAEGLFLNLYMQIKALEKENVGLLYLDPSDIYYIEMNDHKFYFLLLKTDKLLNIEDGKVEVTNPINEKDGLFFSPELESLKTIPVHISYKTSYYSLAMLIVDCLQKEETSSGEKRKKITTANAEIVLKEQLKSLYQTPLYWALERCLMENHENRTLLYI
jgi:hypothetical protein